MKHYFTLLLIGFLALNAHAQKFGYINSQALLVQSPEIKAADSELEAFQKDLISKGQAMVTDFEAKYQKYVEEANSGTLSQVEMQQKESTLSQAQQEIQKYEVQVQNQVLEKRQVLYKPILDKIKQTLDTFASENGYTMIFDSSAGGLLHALPGDDLMDAMKLKLGFN